MSRADLGLDDGYIMSNTRIEQREDGAERFVFFGDKAPREIASDYFTPAGVDKMGGKGKLIMLWCEQVKGQVNADIEFKKEEARRKKQRADSGLDDAPSAESTPSSTAKPAEAPAERTEWGEDPLEYAVRQRDHAAKMAEGLKEERQALEYRLQRAEASHKKWASIVEGLEGDE